MGDLEDLDVAREEPRGDVRLGVGGQQRVDLAVGREQDDREPVRVLASATRRGPARARAAAAVRAGRRRPHASRRPGRRGRLRRRAPPARTGPRRRGAGRGRARRRRGAARSRRRRCGRAAGASARRAASRRTPRSRSCCATFASGGPWSTRTAPSRHLEQDGVALPDVEKRDPEARRRRQLRRRARAARRAAPGTIVAAQASAAGRRQRGSRCKARSASGVPSSTQTAAPEPICASGKPADEPRARGDVGGDPPVQERERDRDGRQQRLDQRPHEREAERAGRSRA